MGTERKPPSPPSVREPVDPGSTPTVRSKGFAPNGNDSLYRELLENANDMIFVQDLAANFTWINKAVTHLTGYTPDEARQMRMQDIVARDHWPIADEHSRRKLTGEQPATTYEVDLIAKNGRRISVEVSTCLIR